MQALTGVSRQSLHEWIWYGSLCILVIMMPLSRYLATVSLIIMAANWIAEGRFRERFRIFVADKPAVALTLIYGLNVIGLLWSKDLHFALFNDLLHKLPILILPVIFATSPVPDAKRIRLLLFFFIASVFAVSLIGISNRIILSNYEFRDASPFIIGLYYSMLLILAAFQLPSLIRQSTDKVIYYRAGLAISAWLIFYLFYLRSLSGIASFAGVILLLLITWLAREKRIAIRVTVITLIVLIAGVTARSFIKIYHETHRENETDLSSLPVTTERGNYYWHDTGAFIRENGNLVLINIADEELRNAWNARSELDFDSTDMSGMSLKFTLYRYMSSKGLNKDGDDFMLLTESDISAVERGITNYRNTKRPGILIRVYDEMRGLYIYRNTVNRDPSMGSMTERLEQWSASWQAFKKHPVFGWGTGSILLAIDYGFGKIGSQLFGRKMKPHNQYLYILLTLGITGLILYIGLYSYAVRETGLHKLFIFKVFLIVFTVNFLANNSFEDQLGHNPFVFFTLFYIYFHPVMTSGQNSRKRSGGDNNMK
ncbi:MAG: O-antigen ligase family protein [Bacteroidales bacterium]